MIETITSANGFVNGIVWGPIGLALLFITGCAALAWGLGRELPWSSVFGVYISILAVTALLLIWCVLSFSSVSIFLYFNF